MRISDFTLQPYLVTIPQNIVGFGERLDRRVASKDRSNNIGQASQEGSSYDKVSFISTLSSPPLITFLLNRIPPSPPYQSKEVDLHQVSFRFFYENSTPKVA